MIIALLAFLLIVVIIMMATLGAVLLARFVLGRCNPSGRIVAAGFGGPLTVAIPVFAIALSDYDARPVIEFAAIFGGVLFAFCVVGWPIAHFATRRLDRLTRFDPQVFE